MADGALGGNGASYFIEIGVLVPAILSASLPSPFTMRTFANNPESVKTLRIGEVVGGSMVVLLGVAESIQHGSIMPMVLVVVIGVAWFSFIEWAIRNPVSDVHSMADGNKAAAAPSTSPVPAAVPAGLF